PPPPPEYPLHSLLALLPALLPCASSPRADVTTRAHRGFLRSAHGAKIALRSHPCEFRRDSFFSSERSAEVVLVDRPM
ncbi:MAG: hypothetical protein ACYC26_10360, partial [Phycisphaerales bacterium]